ncbi:unnamed protein product [Adineta steineri]|uniref:Molybdate-anion transporter n=1 Tax=Adineta steineri TaxID=433720 RepID=A0A819LVW3_9BILA|nr:unnamed protein product [Adineta steineri]
MKYNEKTKSDILSTSSSVFNRLRWIYLIGFLLKGAGNNLHGSYRYALYESYGLSRSNIELIYIVSYTSSLVIDTGASFVSIGAGIFAEVLVKWSNYAAPFNMSVVFFTLSIIFIWKFWSENYGNKDVKATHSFILAFRILRADPRIVILGLCIAAFEASLFLFIINWTPVLERTRSSTDQNSLPLGFIFAGYMSLISVLIGFILFEFCVGISRPSISVFKNTYIANEMAMLCMIILRGLKIPEEQVYVNETEILLEKSSSPLNISSSSVSLTLEHSTKSKEDN